MGIKEKEDLIKRESGQQRKTPTETNWNDGSCLWGAKTMTIFFKGVKKKKMLANIW